jgi:hypothetical protein
MNKYLVLLIGLSLAFNISQAQRIRSKGLVNGSQMRLTGGISTQTLFYVPGKTMSLSLNLFLTNTDDEFGDSLSITVPDGFTILSVTPNTSIGNASDPNNSSGCPDGNKSGEMEPYRGISGRTVSWGDNDNCFGGIPTGSNLTIVMQLSVDQNASGLKTFNYFISGDTWGPDPADLSSSFLLQECPAPIIVNKNFAFCSGDSVLFNGTYYKQPVTAYDTLKSVFGCDSIVIATINEVQKPNLIINASTDTVCSNGEVVLTGNGASNLSWNNFITNGSPFYPTTSDFYVLTGYNTLGCEDKDSIYIHVKPKPTNLNAFVNVNFPVCAGTSITHTASSDSYVKVNNNGNVSTLPTLVTSSFGSQLPNNLVTAAAVLVNDGTPITYNACETILNNLTGKVAIIERGGCNFVVKCLKAQNAGAIAVIVVNNQPGNLSMGGTDPNITIPCMSISQADGAAIISSLQNNNPVTISYGGSASSPQYTWLVDGVQVGFGPTYVFSPSSFYTVQLIADLNGCTASTQTFTNPVNPNYRDTIRATVCQGDSIYAQGGYQKISGIYYDNLVSVFGCDSITVTYLNVLPANDIPSVTISADLNQVCAGGLVTLTASGADTYSWVYNGEINNTTSTQLFQTTTFIVYGTKNSSQCRDTAMITIQAKPVPNNVSSFVNVSLPACAGTEITHTATSDSYISVNNNGNSSSLAASVSSSFGSPLPSTQQEIAAILVDDGTPITYNACEPIINNLTGKVAVIERGGCSFDVKCLAAQNAGAIAVVVVNNQSSSPLIFSMGVSGNVDASLINIPCMMISQSDGASIISSLQSGKPVFINFGGPGSVVSYSFLFTENGINTNLNGISAIYTPHNNYELIVEADLNGCKNSSPNYSISINPEFNDTINRQACIGSTYVFGGRNITADGTYYDSTATVQTGCDSVIVLNIVFTNQITNLINVNICNGESYLFGGQTLTSSGQYTSTFSGYGGCDSVVTLNLTVLSSNQSPVVSIQPASNPVCEGKSVLLEASGAANYTWLNQNNNTNEFQPIVSITSTYTVVGYNDYMQCADTTSITITTKPSPTNLIAFVDVTFPICAGTSVTHTSSADGTIKIKQSILDEYQIKAVHTSSFGSDLPINETTYEAVLVDDQSGDTFDACEAITNDLTGKIAFIKRGSCNFITKCYNAQLAGAVAVVMVNNQSNPPFAMAGNDPNIIIPCLMVSNLDGDIIINQLQSNQPVQVTIGGGANTPQYTWVLNEVNGNNATSNNNPFIYSPSSNYSLEVSANLGGCTSSVSYFNTVNPIIRDSVTIQACNGSSVLVGNLIVNSNGEYIDTLSTVLGCDSIIVANVSFVNTLVKNISASICSNETYSFGGDLLNIQGTYTDTISAVAGCDSVIVLNLVVNPTNLENIAKTICEGDFYPFGSQSPSTAGVYTETFVNKFGCDSVVTLNLTVKPISSVTASKSICEGSSYVFGSQTITNAGVYTEVLNSIFGCDSTVTLTVSINPLPSVSIVAALDTVCDNGGVISLDGSPNGFNNSGVYFGSGVVDSTFNPSGLSGEQIVYYGITDANGCYNEDSTIIFVEICTGINTVASSKVSIASNPFTNHLKINVQGNESNSVLITDLAGRVIYSNTVKGSLNIKTDDFVKGIYFVNVTLLNETKTFKVVKQ